MNDKIQPWSRIDSLVLADYRIFRLRRDRSRSPRTGLEHEFFVLDTGDWVNVVPVTPDNRVVLIRQYRHGIEEVTLEIPGGMVDDDDGAAKETAERELLEETGYVAEEMIYIGSVTPNPAILSNRCHTFLARNVRPVGPPQLDGSEDIQIELADLDKIPGLIVGGQISHALVIAAFYFHEQYIRKG